MKFDNVKINNYNELVKLPWFQIRDDGKMAVKPGTGVPPILDIHTHLGWSYFGGRVVEYQRQFPETVQYYDYSNAEVDLHKDLHPTKKEADGITWDIAFILFRCPPAAKTQTAANMLEEMDRFGVVSSVISPIEVPIRSRHAYQCCMATQPHERLNFFAAVHPRAFKKHKKLRLDWQLSQGAVGLKYHPEFQFTPPDTKGAFELFEMCSEHNMVILGHSGSTGTEPKWMQKLSAPERYIPVIEKFPNLKIILAHTAIIHYEEAIRIAKKYPNVYLETSGQCIPVLRKVFDEFDRERVLYGSDWTFFPLGVPIARAMAALEGYPQELKENYFWRNAVRLLGFDEKKFREGRVVKKKK